MSNEFGKAIKAKLAELGMRPSELARRSGTTRQNISRLINGTPHAITGAAPKAEIETVERIAKALDWDIDAARLLAGYAPITNGHNGILEGFDALSREDQELASRQIKAIIEIFLSKGAVVEVPSHAAPVINEQRKVA